MTEATYNFLLDTLIEEIKMHPHRDELLQLMEDQLTDDTFVLSI
jgi:hypothetical protein